MRTFAFMARQPFEKLTIGLYKAIVDGFEPEARGIFIVTDAKEQARVAAQLTGYSNIEFVAFGEYMAQNFDKHTVDDLVRYEEKYDCKPIWKYILTDRFLIYRPYDYDVKVTVALFEFWEYVFEKYEVDCFYDEAISTLFTYVAYFVGKKTGTRYLSQILLRGAGMELTHHYVLDDPMQMDVYFDENYKNKTYSDEIKAQADEFLKKFEEAPEVSKYMSIYKSKPHFQASFLKLIPLYIKQRFFNPYVKNPASYMYYEAWKNVFDPVKFYFRYKRYRKYYNKADFSKKYVYFPLHFQPEASTIVCAQKYEKQIFFIDSLAKSLPADTVLYVKEHYTGLGNREESFYTELLKLPNVVIIDPWESPREMVRNAQCVATLTGTAGWEAVLMGKPVIMGGECFYSNAPGVIHTDEIFGNYLDYMANWKKPEREELIQYLCEYLESAFEGDAVVDHEGCWEPENEKLLAASFMEYANAK